MGTASTHPINFFFYLIMSNKNPKAAVTAAPATAVTESVKQEQEAIVAEQAAAAKPEVTQEAPQEPQEALVTGSIETPAEPVVQEQPAPQQVVAPATQPKPAVTQTAKPVKSAAFGKVSAAAAPSGESLDEKLEKILADVPEAFRSDIVRVKLYCKAMAPGKPVSDKTGAAEQVGLYRAIQNIINRQEKYFNPLFTALLAIFTAERNGALGDRYRNRFMEHVVLPKADVTALQNLSHLLHVIGPVATREASLKMINIEKCLASGLTADGQRRVLQFLGV